MTKRMETPCIDLCTIDPVSSLCTGCRRTRAEIAVWATLDARERRRIMADLLRRVSPPEAR